MIGLTVPPTASILLSVWFHLSLSPSLSCTAVIVASYSLSRANKRPLSPAEPAAPSARLRLPHHLFDHSTVSNCICISFSLSFPCPSLPDLDCMVFSDLSLIGKNPTHSFHPSAVSHVTCAVGFVYVGSVLCCELSPVVSSSMPAPFVVSSY